MDKIYYDHQGKAEAEIARDLMPHLHRSPGDILNSELWVVQNMDATHNIALLNIPGGDTDPGPNTVMVLTETDGPSYSMVVLLDAPLIVRPEMLHRTDPGKRAEFLSLLLGYLRSK